MRVMGVTKGNPAQNIFLVTFALCMITFASLLMERAFIFTANQVQYSFQFQFVVGSVPSCYVAHELYEEHIEKPLCGVILHASLYSGREFYRFVEFRKFIYLRLSDSQVRSLQQCENDQKH